MELEDFKHELDCAKDDLSRVYEAKNAMERRYLIILTIALTLMASGLTFGFSESRKTSDVQLAISAHTTTIAVNSQRLTTLEDNYKVIISRLDKISNAVAGEQVRF